MDLGWIARFAGCTVLLATTARAETGLEIEAAYAGEAFASSRAETSLGGLASLVLDLDLAPRVNEHLGTVHVAAFGIHGRGISEQLMDAFGVSGNAASPEVRLFEAWVEQPLGPFALRAGLLSAEEFTVADHSTALLSATFGILGGLSYNIGNPVYPVATPGASARVVTDEVTLRAGVFDGDQRNEHGIPTAIGGSAFAIAEVEIPGTVKLGGWHHTDKGSALYLVLDRQLDDQLGAFARLGVAPSGASDVYVDAGIRVGLLRSDDLLGLGLAFARTDTGPQTVVEASYQLVVTGRLTIQPDLQLLLLRDGTIGVIGTRAMISL